MTAEVCARRTPLHDEHVGLGARMTDFAGWAMPVHYAGLLAEHRAVRSSAGLFDLSHMGEIDVVGSQAPQALAYSLVSDPRRLATGRAQYTMICASDGGVLDDLIVYRRGDEHFLVVANASNAEVVLAELRSRCAPFACTVTDRSARTALIALQGPRSQALLQPRCSASLDDVGYYAMTTAEVAGTSAAIARTGYTGEDGFELFVDAERAATLWRALLTLGDGLVPVGLGARDTLRLEAGMPLYGQELDRTTTPYDAGLGRVAKLDKGDFVGADALRHAAQQTPTRQLVGLEITGRGIARQGHNVHSSADRTSVIGQVTSGTASPTLGVPIAMAYLRPSHAAEGTHVWIDIRGRRVEGRVVALPFYRRRSSS